MEQKSIAEAGKSVTRQKGLAGDGDDPVHEEAKQPTADGGH